MRFGRIVDKAIILWCIRRFESVLGRRLPPTDRDDAIQECWERWLSATPGSDEVDDPFLCAKRAIARWWKRESRHYGMAPEEMIPYFASRGSSKKELDWQIVSALCSEFYAQRARQGGDRAAKAAARDAMIVALLYAGFSDEAIALEIGSTYSSVRTYRKQIKRRLRLILEESAASAHLISLIEANQQEELYHEHS